MIDQKTIDYIRNARASGLSDEVIGQALILNGWNKEQVSMALSVSKEVAATPGATLAAAPSRASKPQWNSYLSVMLAVVLFFALYILSSHIVNDLITSAADVSSKLIVNAFVVVPFLLVAFLIHYSFHENAQKNKYLIIAQPYYIISGWLLIKLFFYASQYILDKNAAYGVYVVLVLIIAVLTGIIFFVQKYVKNK